MSTYDNILDSLKEIAWSEENEAVRIFSYVC